MGHGPRAAVDARHPVHVTMRLRKGLPRMRVRRTYLALCSAFRGGRERGGFRLVHYAVMSNHLHLLVEAGDRRALSTGVQGLAVRIARALNRAWGRRGTVFAERYHERALRTPKEVRHALAYVLKNARKHGLRLAADVVDPFTSGPWFDGWRGRRRRIDPRAPGTVDFLEPVARPLTWLLRIGWRRHGPIPIAGPPGA